MNPKLSSTVSVVKISDTILEFFKTNTRKQIRIKVNNDDIMNLVLTLDGTRSMDQICKEEDVDEVSLKNLVKFLSGKGILDCIAPEMDFEDFEKYRRVIFFLNDYADSHNSLLNYWNKLRNSTVLIVGIGAVGSWVACNLAESGVKNFILIDPDTVDITNLHRQFGYKESDVGQLKADVLEKRLREYDPKIKVLKCYDYLDESTLNQFDSKRIDLMINCADKPNVDSTSLWIGEYGMKRNIPHIVGGGYNLHLSLIGQTVLPGQTACVKCFQKQLEEENKIDPNRVKKLMVKNRKVGSFGPMCSMIASMVGMEAIKVITGCTIPANVNRRGEFDIYTMNIQYKEFNRRHDCEWCGEKGKYFHY